MPIEQVVDRGCDVRWLNRLVVGRKFAPVDLEPRLDQFLRLRVCPCTSDESLNEIVDRYISIDVMANANRAVEGKDGPPRVEPAMGQREVGVGENDAEKQKSVGSLDHLGDHRVARRGEIGPEEDIRRLLHEATSQEGGHDRESELARQHCDSVFQTIAPDFYVHDDRGHFSGADLFDNLLRAFGQRIWIGRPPRQDRHGRGRRIGHIPRELDIDWQRSLPRASQDPCDFIGRC